MVPFFYLHPDFFSVLTISECLVVSIGLTFMSILAYGFGVKAKFLPCSLGWWDGNCMFVERFLINIKGRDYYLPRIATKPYNILFTFSRLCFQLFPAYDLKGISTHAETSVSGFAKALDKGSFLPTSRSRLSITEYPINSFL